MKFHILKRVIGCPKIKSLGKTKHITISNIDELTLWINSTDNTCAETGKGKGMPEPYELRIVQYEGDPGVYLFYCNENGQEITDTYHNSVEEAMFQAEFEFGIKSEEWEDVIAGKP